MPTLVEVQVKASTNVADDTVNNEDTMLDQAGPQNEFSIVKTPSVRGAWLTLLDDRRLSYGLALALIAHLIFFVLLPDIPTLKLPAYDSGISLTVYLETKAEKDEFEQSLQELTPVSLNELNPAPLSLAAQSTEKGDNEVLSDEAPEAKVSTPDKAQAKAESSQSQKPGTQVIRFDLSTIRRFADQEAIRYAKYNPKEVERIARGVNSRRSSRRRTNTEQYKNRFGDIYTRAKSSRGDICYKQQREVVKEEFATNTVSFFRCDKKPLELSTG